MMKLRSKKIGFFILCGMLASVFSYAKPPSSAAEGTIIDERAQPVMPRALSNAISFSEYGRGTVITNQYKNLGIIFGSGAYITSDGSSTRSPVLSGSPLFQGPITGYFVDPANENRRVAARIIKMRVGYLDSLRSVRLYLYDKNNKLIHYHTTSVKGFENIYIKLKDQQIWHWKIMTVADEPAGYAIDDFAAELVRSEAKAEIKLQAVLASSPNRSPEPVTGKDITVKIELKDSSGNIIPNASFSQCTWGDVPDASGGPMGLWGALTSKEGELTNHCQLVFQYSKIAGPKPMSYGDKKITFSGKLSIDGATEQTVTLSKDFKVFFDKTEKDDGVTPNWFNYWKQNGAVAGLDASHVWFDSSQPASNFGAYNLGTGKIALAPLSAESDNPITLGAGSTCQTYALGGTKGIDTLAVTLAHESNHKEIFENWKGFIWSTWNIADDVDSDDKTPHNKGDLPSDWLPDHYELSTAGTNPNFIDTCNTAGIHPSYARYGDYEYVARKAEVGVRGIAANDWANPGAQTNPRFRAMLDQSPVLAVANHLGQMDYDTFLLLENDLSHVAELSDYRPDSAEGLSDRYAEEMIDEDNDGVADYLSIKTQVNVAYEDSLSLVAYIADSQNQLFLGSVTRWSAAAGHQEVEIRIDAQKLREHGVSGRFAIKGLVLNGAHAFGGVIESKIDAYTTQSYQFDAVPPKEIRFTNANYDDRGIDLNGNGLFEQIELAVEVDVNRAGSYRIVGGAGLANGMITTHLPVGKSIVLLPLALADVVMGRDSRPLVVNVLRIFDAHDQEVALAHPNYLLKTQGLSLFEPLIAQIDETSLRDMPVNLDTNPKIDFIGLDVAIVAQEAGVGPYWISYQVFDKHGVLITEQENYIELIRGRQTFGLSIATDPFVRHGVDGPYTLKTFFLHSERDDRLHLVDALSGFTYQTQPYLVRDLQSYDDPSDHSLILSPNTISAGNVGGAYYQSLTVMGGVSPYAFALADGQLPDGMTLTVDGILSGTPTIAGSYHFSVQVTDRDNKMGLQSYVLDILSTLNCPVLTSAASVKGAYALPAVSANGVFTLVEPRNGAHVLKLIFDQPIDVVQWRAQMLANGPVATLNAVRGGNDKEVLINLPSTDAVIYPFNFVAVSGTNQGCQHAVIATFLWGDVNGDRIIDNEDYKLISIKVGSVNASNYLYDIDNSGQIGTIDKKLVQKRIGISIR